MDRFVASQNIERLRRQLAETRDEGMRKTLELLLAQEKEHLRDAEAAYADETRRRSSISSLVERFRNEPDADRRDWLRRRLIEEEDQFGALSHQIDLVDGLISVSALRVERLEALFASRQADGDSSGSDVELLANSKAILETFRRYRADLALRIRENGL